jgi:cbb3-type cytochrome c oxidase subunit III
MKLFASLLIAAAFVAPTFSHANEPTSAAAKPDLAQGEAVFKSNCVECHGAGGNSTSTTYPKLAQQHSEYLLKQLHEFKSGKRANTVMSGIVAKLSEEDMKNVTAWVSTQKAEKGVAKEKALVMEGERIYRGGIADRQIPACAGCHTPTGAGIPSQYPRLSGQHADYATAQLKAFRDGVRKNSVQMTGVAAKLNDREIKAVSDYVAGLR